MTSSAKPTNLLLLGLLLLPLAALAFLGVRTLRDYQEKGLPESAPTERTVRTASDADVADARLPKDFRDVAVERGLDFHMTFLPAEQGEDFKINLYDHGCGLAVADYDGDGDDDVLLLNQLGANALFQNRGDGSFVRVTDDASPLALADRICVGAAFGDFDNDGDQDVYVTSTRGGNVLFENDRGEFRDITEQAGLKLVAHSQTAAFFDYDNDGDLDLYVTNMGKWTSNVFDEADRYFRGPRVLREFLKGNDDDLEYNILYRNDGEGHFSDVTNEVGLQGLGWSGDVAVFDYDDDGFLDVFVANMFGKGQLYHNERGHFRDVTGDALRRTSFGAIGAKAFDHDNDGRFDLFVTDMHSDMWNIPAEAAEVRPRLKNDDVEGTWHDILVHDWGNDYAKLFYFGNSLFRNEGGGRFVERSDAAGMETYWPWGIAIGDFDNDADEDVFIASGMGYPFYYWPNVLMMNDGHGNFADEAVKRGIEPPVDGIYLPQDIGGKKAARSSRCVAAADFNGDGQLDLVVNNFNDRPYYFRNHFPAQHYIAFRLQGVRSNRDAIGAVLRLSIGDRVLVRQVHSAGGYLAQSSKIIHFGLGSATKVDRVEIRWPRGARQTLDDLDIDRLHEVIEPATD